jgi:hypothetical protein
MPNNVKCMSNSGTGGFASSAVSPEGTDENYNLAPFSIDELSDTAKINIPSGHRMPMGILATSGAFWLLLKHEPKLINYISRDPNEYVPNPETISQNGFYITIHSDGFMLNNSRNRLERLRINVWGLDETKRQLGASIICAALAEPPRKYLKKIKASATKVESTSGLRYISITGHFQTMIKEHEDI